MIHACRAYLLQIIAAQSTETQSKCLSKAKHCCFPGIKRNYYSSVGWLQGLKRIGLLNQGAIKCQANVIEVRDSTRLGYWVPVPVGLPRWPCKVVETSPPPPGRAQPSCQFHEKRVVQFEDGPCGPMMRCGITRYGPWGPRFLDICQISMDIEFQNMHLKKSEISFEVPKSTFQCCFKTRTTFKNILEVPAFILAKFPCKIIWFSRKIDENLKKTR